MRPSPNSSIHSAYLKGYNMSKHQLNDQVKCKSIDGVVAGIIIGRSFSNPMRYDIKLPTGTIVHNVPQDHVEPLEIQETL